MSIYPCRNDSPVIQPTLRYQNNRTRWLLMRDQDECLRVLKCETYCTRKCEAQAIMVAPDSAWIRLWYTQSSQTTLHLWFGPCLSSSQSVNRSDVIPLEDSTSLYMTCASRTLFMNYNCKRGHLTLTRLATQHMRFPVTYSPYQLRFSQLYLYDSPVLRFRKTWKRTNHPVNT